MAGRVYLVGAVVLGLGATAVALRAAVLRTQAAARGLFLASVLYLTGICALLLLNRVI
jgi:heme O synthase-like polyprenyltransferase